MESCHGIVSFVDGSHLHRFAHLRALTRYGVAPIELANPHTRPQTHSHPPLHSIVTLISKRANENSLNAVSNLSAIMLSDCRFQTCGSSSHMLNHIDQFDHEFGEPEKIRFLNHDGEAITQSAVMSYKREQRRLLDAMESMVHAPKRSAFRASVSSQSAGCVGCSQ